MGKIRKKITRGNKVSPLEAVMFDQPVEDEMLDSMARIEALSDQLQSAVIEEKINGLQSLATLATTRTLVADICKTDIMRIAAPLLCEPDLAIRSAASGALRNLSVCGPEVCNHMMDQDVGTPLLSLLEEYVKDQEWVPSFDAAMQNQMDLRGDVFLHAVNLLWNLCESSASALEQFNQAQLLEGFIRCLDYNVFGLDIAISMAQCLLVISENNLKCWNTLNAHADSFLYLIGITGEHGYAFLRTLAAGILCNVPALAAAHSSAILKSLAPTLDTQNRDTVSELLNSARDLRRSSEAPITMEIEDAEGDETDAEAAQRRRRNELPTQAEIVLRNIGYTLDAQRVAAEVVTNLLCNDDEEWIDDDDGDDNSDSLSVVDFDDSNETELNNADKLSPETLEVMKNTGIVTKLWQNTKPLDNNVLERLREADESLFSKTRKLRISTLLCLQNLCNILSVEDLGGVQFMYNMWLDLGQHIFNLPQNDIDLLEPSTALMRSALEHLKKEKELFSQMSKADLELVLNGVKVCTMSEIRANWIRMLANLGCLLSEDLTEFTISFILEACKKEEDAWAMSEALDVLMDMFAEDDRPQIVKSLNMPVALKELQSAFKAKVRQQKRELNERYPAVQTVQQNLPRFIKYIEQLAK